MDVKRKFYRTIVRVEVLSEEPYNPPCLEQVAFDITDGNCSGEFKWGESEEISPKKMVKLLQKQGTALSFFRLTDKGEDDDEYSNRSRI